MSENSKSSEKNGASVSSQADVFAVHGADPEVQAYAMAKYSRSALSMKESLREISEQKAEQFLNTFYFQYGHRSIADLAHLAFAMEKLSILAAIILVDEQRWDGQERSTRYQNFKKSGYYVPDCEPAIEEAYRAAADFLFAEYEVFTREMLRYYTELTPRPEGLAEDAYTRTLRARAFDNSRYLLPLATNTSLGQIVNARTLETQISRLLTSPYAEVRRLGEMLKEAAKQPAYQVQEDQFRALVEEIKAADAGLGAKAEQQLLRPVRVSPTLVKYANACEYEARSRTELAQAAAELMAGSAIESAPPVDLLENESLEVEIASTLVYSACHYSYRQIRERVQSLSATQRDEIVDLGMKHRGRHDEPLRAYHSGSALRFDILMDLGGFRDMHRHRRCTQIEQGFTHLHGHETPPDVTAAGLGARYAQAMERTMATFHQVKAGAGAESAAYLLPMAFRKRTLFKMDLAEALYIAELRTAPAGHFSYRNVAHAMFEAVQRQHPSLARHIRVTDVREPLDLLNR